MRNAELILDLPRLLVPSRLSVINALEIIWKTRPFQEQPDGPPFNYDSFLEFIELMPVIFPNLKQLYLSIQGDLKFYYRELTNGGPSLEDKRAPIFNDRFLKPIEGMIANLNCLTLCTVAVPSSRYKRLKEIAICNGSRYSEIRHGHKERIWQPLELSNRPLIDGYWVELGHRDLGNKTMGAYLHGSDVGVYECLYSESCSGWM